MLGRELVHSAWTVVRIAGFSLGILALPGADCRAQSPGGPTLLVFPLEDKSGLRELSWVGEGVALSVAEALGVCGITAVDRDERIALTEQADLPPAGTLSRASMIRIGQAGALDGVVFGSFSGNERDLKLSLRYLDLRSLRMSGEMAAHGALSSLPGSENELAWNLSSLAIAVGGCDRAAVASRKRAVPNSAYALYVRSLQSTDEDEQVRLAERAVGIYGAFPAAQYRLGRHFALTGDCPAAIRHLEPIRGSAGVPVDSLLMLGTCMMKTAELDGAIKVLSAYLSFSRDAGTLNNLGVAYLRKGELAFGAEYLSEARRRSPTDAVVLLNLAILRHLQQNPAALVALIRENPASAKASAQLQLLYGDALAGLGEVAAAEEALARAKLLGSDPARLRSEDLRSWTRVLTPWLPQK